jgi:hypothetical protein
MTRGRSVANPSDQGAVSRHVVHRKGARNDQRVDWAATQRPHGFGDGLHAISGFQGPASDRNYRAFIYYAAFVSDLNKNRNVLVNFGEAWRYPTVMELYRHIAVNGVATFANSLPSPNKISAARSTSVARLRSGAQLITSRPGNPLASL